MDMPNRLPLLKSAFKLLVDNLREKDTVSIVVYGSAVGVSSEHLLPVEEKEKIRKAIEELNPGRIHTRGIRDHGCIPACEEASSSREGITA